MLVLTENMIIMIVSFNTISYFCGDKSNNNTEVMEIFSGQGQKFNNNLIQKYSDGKENRNSTNKD